MKRFRSKRMTVAREGWRRWLVWLVTSGVAATAGAAGEIVGTVRAESVAVGGGGAASGGAYASRRFKFVEKVDYARLKDFVVYIDEVVSGAPGAPKDPVAVVTQQDAMFDPHVLPVVVGTTVTWPNRDDIYHNVFSMSEAAGDDGFDLGLYKGDDAAKSVTFARRGRIDVFCSIHANMHCIVLALPSPYFAKVDTGRRFEIRDVPAGTYRLRAWHERVPGKTMEVVVPERGTVEVEFVLGFGAPAAAADESESAPEPEHASHSNHPMP